MEAVKCTPRAMLSQPIAGCTKEVIIEQRAKAIFYLVSRGYDVVNTFFDDEWYNLVNMTKRGVVQLPLCYLAKSIENTSLCDAVCFCKGWESARGCRIEHEIATAYGLKIIYE